MNRYFPQSKPALILFLLFLLFFCPGLQANETSDIHIDADRQFEYANQLFENKEYAIAASEYIRFIHFFKDDERVKTAMYKAGVSYFMDGEYKRAVTTFRKVIDKYQDTDISNQASFMMSRSYLSLGEPGSAVNSLYNLVAVSEDEDIKARGNYEIGWIYLENPKAGGPIEYKEGYESFPGLGAADTSKSYFQKISSSNREKYRIGELSSGIDRLQETSWKNPVLAGSLSVIPGAGQAYCGRYQDGLVAFILNTAFIFAAIESFDNESPVLGGLISIVGAGFYVGNIYGAVSDAHKYNRRLYKHKVDELRQTFRVELAEKGGKKALTLSFRTEF